MDETLLYHKPVLINEVLEYMHVQPGKVYLDVTFGSGGHTRAMLEKEPTCRVIAMDWDSRSLDTYGPPLQDIFGDRLTLVWGNFALLYKVLKREKIYHVDGILADFGTSQMQIVERAGFSVHRDTPLDMRMSPSHQTITAADIINKSSEEKLRELFWQLGEESQAKIIVRAIMDARFEKPITTTAQLVQIIEKVCPRNGRPIHPATKVFQALRIYVNKELENISSFLAEAIRIINPGGRLVCISFHSLEDRIVKQFFNDQARLLTLDVVTPKVVVATEKELHENPSARSAHLRAAQIRSKAI